MESRDYFGALADRQHGAGEKSGSRMWHGVVNMQNIQFMPAADLCHLHRKRQGVVGIFEEIVTVDLNGMKENPRANRHAERLLVADKMNFVTALGQFVAQFGSENSTAADRRVAGDADLERKDWRSWQLARCIGTQSGRSSMNRCARRGRAVASESNTSGSFG